MGYIKSPKTNDSLLVSSLVTLHDLNAMADFIKKFKLKYSAKKLAGRKKK